MKVVLFCGGKGMRLREYSEQVPKPMVNIGYRPILWHVMKYYAHFGHKDFVLCLGYMGDVIKKYFLDYNECLSNDFVLKPGSRDQVKLLNRDIDEWTITFVDTGADTNIGGRLRAVRKFVEDEEMFLANYSDALTDLPLTDMVGEFKKRPEAMASFLCIKPSSSFHFVGLDGNNQVTSITDVRESDVRINGGYFALRNGIFDYMREGEELVHEPFQRLIGEGKLHAYKYDRFWQCMDTFKEKQQFDDWYAQGKAPWELWRPDGRMTASAANGVNGANGVLAAAKS